jgi:hypothetical protein
MTRWRVHIAMLLALGVATTVLWVTATSNQELKLTKPDRRRSFAAQRQCSADRAGVDEAAMAPRTAEAESAFLRELGKVGPLTEGAREALERLPMD